MTRTGTFGRLLIVALALVLVSSACGDSSDDSASTSSSSAKGDPTACRSDAPATTAVPVAEGADVAGVVKARKPPKVVIPSKMPADLATTDLIEGTGAAVVANDEVTVQYVGITASNCEVFQSTWEQGAQPATFTLDHVIPGWSKGLVGMKPGGRRLLLIPTSLAYGEKPENGAPAGPLAFVVDLISIGQKPDPEASAVAISRGRPTVTVPDSAPTEAQITDLVVGSGPELTASTVTAIVFSEGKQAPSGRETSSWTETPPTPQRLPMAQLDPVIAKALLGMKVGGRRQLVVQENPPPTTATGPTTTVGGPQRLVLVIDLLGVG